MSDLCQCPVCGRMHRHLGTPPLSVSEQIARDMKQGTFPQKSKDTLLEEAADRIEALEAALRFMLTDPPAALDEPDTDAEIIQHYREVASAALAKDADK